MNLANDKSKAAVLDNLLHTALRYTRFSVKQLTSGDVEFQPHRYGGSTSTTFENFSEKVLDAVGLMALQCSDAWKRQMFDFDIQVEALHDGVESQTRQTEFEALLDDLGVLFDGHVGHALGPVIPGYSRLIEGHDSLRVSVGVSKSTVLWNYLLIDACLGTPRGTANKVLRWARGTPLAFETRILFGGLNAASSFTLPSGIAVERLPRKSEHLDSWLPTSHGVPLREYLDRTVLRIPCTISPVLSKPTNEPERPDQPSILSWRPSANFEATWPLAAGGIDQLMRALSLVCDVAVETPVIWTDYGDNAHFGQGNDSSNSGSGEPPPRTTTESTLTADDLQEAVRLQPDLCKLSSDLETALHYWLKSKSRHPDAADCLVFLRTSLEALFLPGGNKTELTFRLATNGAWYTGRNSAERRQRFDTLKKVYAAASGAVHAGRVKRSDGGLLKEGQAICRLAILKRLRLKQAPVWEDIVFGQ